MPAKIDTTNQIGEGQMIRVRRYKSAALALAMLAAAACGSGSEQAEPSATTAPTAAGSPPAAGSSPTPTQAPSATARLSPTPAAIDLSELDPVERSLANRFALSYGWATDFSKKTINLAEIDVLLARDQIVPVDEPEFSPVASPPDYMEAREPVIALEVNGDARAYPLAMLMWHEIVNDTVGGVPVTVTFCPLCNSALVFERTVDGTELTFGTSGALRNSDLIMWDRQTESWWQQITGEAIAGHYAGEGTRLKIIPAAVMAWESFAASFSQGRVLERIFDERGFPIRRYDVPPYAGYDSVDNTNPFAFEGPTDGRLPAAARVLAIEHGGQPVAYPYSYLKENPVLNDSVGDLEFVAIFDSDTLSAFVDLREDFFASGSVVAFSRDVDGQTLTFELSNGKVVDNQTNSTWDLAGLAVDGPLAGTRLTPIVYGEHFWFAWSVFKPDTEIRGLQ